ncbi:hypothetical protein [Myroides sp. LJL119]
MNSIFGNDPRELAIAVFYYLDNIKNKVDIENGFDLNILIDEFLEWNLPIDGSNYQKQKKEEIPSIINPVRLYFTSNGYFEIIRWENEDIIIKLTEKGLQAKRYGGLDKYEQKLKNEEEQEQLKRESLLASVEANVIAIDANNISTKTNEIAIRALWISAISALVALSSLLYTFSTNNAKEIDFLKDEIKFIKKKQGEEQKEYLKILDSLSNKVKNK